jgi:hypothetical protein
MACNTASVLTNMRRNALFGAAILLLLTLTMTARPVSADTLVPNDFKLQSFSKTIDFYDFARSQAASLGSQRHPQMHTHTSIRYTSM